MSSKSKRTKEVPRDLSSFFAGKGKVSRTDVDTWLPYCELVVINRTLWAGDPYIDNEDGCFAKVPNGHYIVEGIPLIVNRLRVVSRVRVRLEDVAEPKLGKEIGSAGTDSAMIGICDIKAFEAAWGDAGNEKRFKAIEAKVLGKFGPISKPKSPQTTMALLPTGSDGTGPVYELVSKGKRVGIELPIMGEETQDDAPISLIHENTDDFKTWPLKGGGEATFWVKELYDASVPNFLWSEGGKDPAHYRVIRERGSKSRWFEIKKKRGYGGVREAKLKLPPGRYTLEFKVDGEIFSGINLDLKIPANSL